MVIEFPIGETQRNEQNRLSREWVRGLAGHIPSAEIIEFPAMPRQTEPLCKSRDCPQYGGTAAHCACADLAECEFSS